MSRRKTLARSLELAVAAPAVIAMRTSRMLAAGAAGVVTATEKSPPCGIAESNQPSHVQVMTSVEPLPLFEQFNGRLGPAVSTRPPVSTVSVTNSGSPTLVA